MCIRDSICIEDLNVSGMMKNRYLSKAVQEQGFFWFRKQLEYKCSDKAVSYTHLMADPSAMSAALYPECIEKCEKYYCEVDVSAGPSYGLSLIHI